MNSLPWELVRAFLAVAERGSLSAAAPQLGLSQPTLSRQIQALEREVGVDLFQRSVRGLVLTEHGAALMPVAEEMARSASRFERLASGLSPQLEGEVRISANEIVGHYLLPSLLTRFRREHPGVRIEVVISNRATSLSRREADIALRMFRPSQPDLVAQRLPDLELGLFASRDYLRSAGTPEDGESLRRHTLIGFDEDESFIDVAAQLGLPLERGDFALRSDSMPLHIELMRSGAGIGATHVGIAEGYPELVRVLPELSLPKLEFWIVSHRDVRFNPRIRQMVRFLHQQMRDDPYQSLPSQ